MSESALRAERITLAILSGDVTPDADVFADLRLANRERAVEQDVAALRAFQSGAQPWSVPAQAPWSGFGSR